MTRHIVDSRQYLSPILTVGIGTLLSQRLPFPDDNAILSFANNPSGFISRRNAFITMMKSANFLDCYDRAIFYNLTRDGALFAERQMGA